ncbi:sulfite exporter TauE/SafE family protein [Nitrospira sp. KM1]|uniref:HoxN/HupN/NixA family nickel/cobalt transporter n=1 Tax=Nitrospira sp. KM1 TaxID=1936990 RepID=UPI001563D81D|nr:sulfite exporter TauE/SafE family protein [Nitrospira sp. KM1]
MTTLALGFVLGIRHALDSDHIAAVSTILAQRPSWRASGLIGFSWGIGHTLVLLLVGSVVLLFRVTIPEAFAVGAEFVVGAMLVALGCLLGFRLLRERWHVHAHEHGGEQHVHLHSHRVEAHHEHTHWWSDSIRPLCIGMAHGLAGSAALLLIVLASAHTTLEGIVYIVVFGIGSIAGMMLIGYALSIPVTWSMTFGRSVFQTVQGIASLGSIGLGFWIIAEIIKGAMEQ